jgi:hypothetical protein
MGAARLHVTCNGHAPTIEQAKTAFAASLEAFRNWKPADS